MMDADRWKQVRSIFDDIVELAPEGQADRLAAIGKTDPDLRSAVADLLAGDSETARRLADLEAVFLVSPDERTAAASARDPFGLVGRMVSHFQILEPLESGGMGAVYRALDTRLDRTVALKVPLPGYRLDDSNRQRFLREARSAAALDHANLCSIYEVGESEDGHPFFAMPLYPGETLKVRLARSGPLPIMDAVEIARQIAAGLGAAHDAGIVHRDVKPANVMLLPDGVVKLLDFGLAKAGDVSFTSTRAQLGTVSYMAPEQIQGTPVDGRSDLWALGAVLYESLTGCRPFEGDRDVAVALAIVHGEPMRPSRLRSDIPPALEGILFTLLRKNQADRPANAHQVVADLAGVRIGRAPPAAQALRQRWAALTGWRRRRATRAIAFGVAATTLVTAVLLAPGRNPSSPPVSRATEASIAVLPFVNMSGDSEQEYLSDGITEELTTHLARVTRLRVAARTSALQFGGTDADVLEAGRRLGVASVLQGTVQKYGTRVRVTARLTDAGSGYHLWAEAYDIEQGDVLTIPAAVSDAILVALRIAVDPPVATRVTSTRNPEAHDLYLKGRYSWNQRTEDALVRAMEFFRQAVALDPDYAAAYSGLADVEIAPRAGRPADRFARAKTAASRALELDPSLPEAHLSMAWVNMWYDRDWSGADQHLLRANELDPDYPWAMVWHAAWLAAVGRIEESLPLLRRAAALDPLAYVHATYLGTHYLWLRREDEAAIEFRKALELEPDFFMAHWGLARTFLAQGRYTEALAELRYEGGDFTGLHGPGLLGYAYGLAGNDEEARRILDELKQAALRGEYVPPTSPAIIHIALGETEQALDWLERVEDDRGARIFFVDPIFDAIRDEPRFVQLVQRFGLDASLFAR